jgi:2-polyprenyl-3-methyl-5-hydroxy-6-metoxy-1,4-benzoquinol methylase
VEYDADNHSFTLPDEHALFLADSESEYYLASLFQSLPTMAAAIPQLVDAFKHGGGVSFRDYGSELPRTLSDMNRTVYESRLVKTWMPFMPEAVQRLQAGGKALDIGCGMGVVALALARGFPQAQITGIDVDAHSIALAKARSAEIDDPQRLQFLQSGVEELPTGEDWDFISTFDVIHDLPDPVTALGHMRRALNQGGTYLMVEPKVADDLKDNLGNPFARMLYGISCLHCVPQSLASGGLGLGACWGEKRARALAAQAGFQHFERLDIRSPALAFYALRA